MDKLRVRVYNVRFGDAILVSFPERADGGVETRHVLIDVGNALSGAGGDDAAFRPVMEDIAAVLGGRALDLYVMTHEHLDHVQGLYFAKQDGLRQFPVAYAWLPASAEPTYEDRNPRAKERRMQLQQYLREINEYLDTLAARPAMLEAMLRNNDPRRTEACVNYLRMLARTTSYVHRGFDLAGRHPFTEATIRILGPEWDTSIYYGRFQPLTLGFSRAATKEEPGISPRPPPGVDAGSFHDLVESRRRGYVDTLLAIDRAANNTSIVFQLEWRGWRLLFPGDAEVRSWKEMDKRNLLESVHFLKVSHHGSSNGLPPRAILDKILPEAAPDNRPRRAVVSTCEGSYPGVPDRSALAVVGQRCNLSTVENLPLGDHLDVEFPG